MARVWQCARCGSAPRWGGTFLCEPCATNPVKESEISQAQKATRSIPLPQRGMAQRRYLVKTFRWAGKWSTRG